jgi:hypothetical protein
MICLEDLAKVYGTSTVPHLSASEFWTPSCAHTEMHDHCLERLLRTTKACPKCNAEYTISGLRAKVPALRSDYENGKFKKVLLALHAHFPKLDMITALSHYRYWTNRKEVNRLKTFGKSPDSAIFKLILADVVYRCFLTRLAVSLARSAMRHPEKLTKTEHADAMRLEGLARLGAKWVDVEYIVGPGNYCEPFERAGEMDPAAGNYWNLTCVEQQFAWGYAQEIEEIVLPARKEEDKPVPHF